MKSFAQRPVPEASGDQPVHQSAGRQSKLATKTNVSPTPVLIDHHPAATRQHEWQARADKSPGVQRLAELQLAADRSFRVQQLTQLRARSTHSVQRMKAYDETKLATDPRHFSTPKLKAAIDACIDEGVAIPGWLKEVVLAGLADERLLRDQDLARHNGGDERHQHYAGVVEDYAEEFKKLPKDEKTVIPTEGPAFQLKAKPQGQP